MKVMVLENKITITSQTASISSAGKERKGYSFTIF
jgi:hypothetical protein